MFLPPLLCFVLAGVALALLLRSGLAAHIAIDRPNERSLHAAPIPRIGGIVVVAVALTVSAYVAPSLRPLLSVAAAVGVVSAWDDRHSLPVLLRLMVHFAAATVAVVILQMHAPAWIMVLAVLLLTWAMNLYNFMDGADGMAGGMAVLGFGALGIAAVGPAPEIAVACLCIAAAAGGFLWHNFHPARVFLGDAGSISLGLLAGGLGLAGWIQGAWPPWFPVLVFSPFIVDASLTLAVRLLRGNKPWRAHREHLYQRMVRSGLGHGRTAMLWYAVMIAAGVTAIAALSWPIGAQFGLLTAWAAVYATVFALTWRLGIKSDR